MAALTVAAGGCTGRICGDARSSGGLEKKETRQRGHGWQRCLEAACLGRVSLCQEQPDMHTVGQFL